MASGRRQTRHCSRGCTASSLRSIPQSSLFDRPRLPPRRTHSPENTTRMNRPSTARACNCSHNPARTTRMRSRPCRQGRDTAVPALQSSTSRPPRGRIPCSPPGRGSSRFPARAGLRCRRRQVARGGRGRCRRRAAALGRRALTVMHLGARFLPQVEYSATATSHCHVFDSLSACHCRGLWVRYSASTRERRCTQRNQYGASTACDNVKHAYAQAARRVM